MKQPKDKTTIDCMNGVYHHKITFEDIKNEYLIIRDPDNPDLDIYAVQDAFKVLDRFFGVDK